MSGHETLTPPNGGWGWVIVIASFFSNFIVDGVLYTFGIFFVDLLGSFDAPKAKIALVGSLLGGIYLIVGMIFLIHFFNRSHYYYILFYRKP